MQCSGNNTFRFHNSSAWRHTILDDLALSYIRLVVSAYRYIAITNLPITAVFVEYLRQFLIDLNQIYRHSSVPKKHVYVHFLSFLAQAISEHGATVTFFCHYVCVTA